MMTDMPGKDIDTLVDTLYDSVSGPPGLKRDWDEMCTLFIPGADIMRTDVPEGGCTELKHLGVIEFFESIEGFMDQKGFYGKEIDRRTETNGNFAKVVSVYEGRFDPNDKEPFRLGTNTLRLYNDGRRWWIFTMLVQ